jgi:hypothetical protein
MRKELMDKLKRGGMPGAPAADAAGMDGAFQHPDSEISPEGSGSEEEDEGQALTPLLIGGTSLKPGIKKPKA